MIIGDGLLARSFAPLFAATADVIVFASGVSNSLETSHVEFERERTALIAALHGYDGRVVYFGSCSVTDADRYSTPYARHKLAMESIVLGHAGSLVVRLPQVVGPTGNPHTLTNFLHRKIANGQEFHVWEHAERNLIDVDDVVAITERLVNQLGPADRSTIAIASERSMRMPQIVAAFENVIGRKALCTMECKGAPLRIDAQAAQAIARELGIDLGEGYVDRLIRKYYGP